MSSKIEQHTFGQNADISLLSQNISWLMRTNAIDSASLSEKTGIAVTTINSLKRGVGNPTYSTLVSLGAFFNISVSQLTEIDLSNNSKKEQKFCDIPLLTINDLSNYLTSRKKIRESVSIKIDHDSEKCFAIKITTNSMSPFFEKGSIFVVNSAIHPQDGDIVLVKFSDQLPCFRKIFIEGSSYFFKPVTESLVEVPFKNNDYIIHGVVVTAIQNFHDN